MILPGLLTSQNLWGETCVLVVFRCPSVPCAGPGNWQGVGRGSSPLELGLLLGNMDIEMVIGKFSSHLK